MSNSSKELLFRAKLDEDQNSGEVLVHFNPGDMEAMTFNHQPTMEKRRKFTSRPSNTSTQHQQTRMSTSDLRGVGISAPTGFVHVSGYSNRSGYRGSISESTTTVPVSSQSPQPMNVVQLRDQSNNRTSRMRELSNIDPKFTSQSGLCSSSELETSRGSIRIQHLTAGNSTSTTNCNALEKSSTGENYSSRFPRLESCAHFHYECTDIGPLTVELLSEDDEFKYLSATKSETQGAIPIYSVHVSSNGKSWVVRRSYENFEFLDRQAHQCIFDRKYSQLSVIPQEENVTPTNGRSHKDSVRHLLSSYLHRFSTLAGPVITCGPVLNWLELDNRGHRLIVTDDCAINTPAVAAAYAIKRYAKQASDEISFEVGDMISVIDMPPPEESIWWRGKRGFEVGFFPCECVEVIGDKVPQGLNLPIDSNHRLRKNSMGSEGEEDSPGGPQSSGGSPTSPSGHEPTKPVLRKHGKLISFFRSFILSRPARGKLKKSGILKERVFGCDLSEHLLNTGSENSVPKVLTHCAEFIEARGIIDGIYRLSGIASNIQKLRVAFDEDRVPNLYDDRGVLQDIHSVSSLLKMYFRELPNPVCTYHLYEKFVEAAKAPENQRLVLMRDVVQQLPPPNYRTLEYLSRHLYRVALRGHETGMTPKNVAIVWAPNLLRAKNLETGGVAALQGVGVQAVVTEYLIRYCELIFSDKLPSYNTSSNPASVINEESNKKLRPKSLAISTPTKLLSLEEARQRAALQNNAEQKYIEVGGGPKSLPQKYHTVIDLPGRRSMKQRKSPIGWKAIFKSKAKNANGSRSKPTIDLITNTENGGGQASVDNDLRMAMPRSLLRPVKSAESLVGTASGNIQRSQSERRTSRNDLEMYENSSEDSDDLAPLEVVSKALNYKDSPRTHNRSSSHDSYFEARNFNSNSNSNSAMDCTSENEAKMDSTLDLSEIQVNFELEENEMKIFSEDEAMMTNSFDSDFSKSPLLEESKPLVSAATVNALKTSSPKLTSSGSGIGKVENQETSPKTRKMSFREKFKRFTSPTPNRKVVENNGGDESSSDGSGRGDTPPRELKSAGNKTEKTLRERIVCALSPESLRKRDNQESSPKKKKSNFSPGTSPNNTSQLIKRSKIEEDEVDCVLEEKEIKQPLPLSPSINFIDASMTESFESVTKPNQSQSDIKDQKNPRFSTTSSTEGDDQQLDQLVVAEVHHEPIMEIKETDNEIELTEDDDLKKSETNSVDPNATTTESYSIAGATVSENESFSLTSDEDLTNKPLLTTQASSEEQEQPEAEANSEAAIPSIMLPANHVIQYSPRLLASNKSSWSPEMQTYEDQEDKVEPMEIDNNLVNRDSGSQPRDQELLKQLSCPLYPRGECHVVKTELRLDLQLDHDQNSNGNSAGAVDVTDAAEDLKGDINNLSSAAEVQIAETPSPKPRSSFSQKSAVAESASLSSESGTTQSPEASSNRKPVPTPRKSVTLMEVDQEPPSPHHRAASALSHHEKKISFSIESPRVVKKKLSTFSLHNHPDSVSIPEEAPLQRRNSIHNVPYVDVNDPNTRQRMERYKEERRSLLRAKYKVEDYMNTEEDQDFNKYRRKSSETKASNEDLSNCSKTQENETEIKLTEDLVILRCNNIKTTEQSSSPIRETGLIDEDVNVKERAAIFGGSTTKNNRAKSWTANLITSPSCNNSKNNTNAMKITRPISDTTHVMSSQRKMSPGSPSKIRDMAAFFEQQKS